MENFKILGMSDELIKAIKGMGFTNPTTIQEKTIPHVIDKKDVIAESATGSGKTLAFSAGIVQNTQKGKGNQALILTPTRELAMQISDNLNEFSRYNKLKVATIYGGVSYNPQIDSLRKSEIVVGTPGRILDLLQRNDINLSGVKTLILDEADRMLDMGFLPDVKNIMSQCPENRQTLLFSATMAKEIRDLSKKFMNNPVHVSVDNQVDPRKLPQCYYNVHGKLKFSLLVHLLKKEEGNLVMIFCNSRHSTDNVAKNLKKAGIKAYGIHGGLTQNKRSQIIEDFNSGKAHALVCTDVAARGLDIPDISHVYNYDIPNDPKQYVHRIGRTARAGKSGLVINILSTKDYDNFNAVLDENDFDIVKKDKPFIKEIKFERDDDRREKSRGFRKFKDKKPFTKKKKFFGKREN